MLSNPEQDSRIAALRSPCGDGRNMFFWGFQETGWYVQVQKSVVNFVLAQRNTIQMTVPILPRFSHGSFEVTVTSVSLPPFVSRRGLSNPTSASALVGPSMILRAVRG